MLSWNDGTDEMHVFICDDFGVALTVGVDLFIIALMALRVPQSKIERLTVTGMSFSSHNDAQNYVALFPVKCNLLV